MTPIRIEATRLRFGKKKKGRPISGVLLLDKPEGITSNHALQQVRRLFGAQKAGHTGSLDPLATGVLPICFGEATKFSRYLLDADKAYFTTAKLGIQTNTGDVDGEVLTQTNVPEFATDALEAVLEKFRGDINQIPSMYSALKHQGRPLYEWAREGVTVDRPARPITIFKLQLDHVRPDELDLTVECSKGTYIRSLVEDIGEALGCGAHVCALRRYKAGHFKLEDTLTLPFLQQESEAAMGDGTALDRFLLPVDCLLPDLPEVRINNGQTRSILHGQAVRISSAIEPGLVRLYCSGDESAGNDKHVLLGVAEMTPDKQLQPRRLLQNSALAGSEKIGSE